jgi:hypothetical protein
MIVKKHILKTLVDLDERYKVSLLSPTQQDAIFFSKLAVLEYCGWVEEAFDLIVKRSVNKRLKTQPFKQILQDKIIGNNYGFQYKENFRPMLIQSIGLCGMERIENYLKTTGQLEVLKSELAAVKTDRNNAAHTWTNGATRTYPSPSIIISRLQTIYPIAKDLYSQMVKL